MSSFWRRHHGYFIMSLVVLVIAAIAFTVCALLGVRFPFSGSSSAVSLQ